MTKLNNKVNEVRNLIVELIENTDNTRKLALESGVDQAVIYKLANGQKSFDNLSLKTVEKLYKQALIFKVLDKAEELEMPISEIDLIGNRTDLEEGETLFTKIEYGQYGWNFDVIMKATIYFDDRNPLNTVVTYSMNEIKLSENATYAELSNAFYSQYDVDIDEKTFFIDFTEDEANIFIELMGGKSLYNLYKEQKETYVVDISKQDKTVFITVDDCGDFIEYAIEPAYLKDIDYLVDMILDERLDRVFYDEIVTDNYDGFDDALTMKEVKEQLEMYTRLG